VVFVHLYYNNNSMACCYYVNQISIPEFSDDRRVNVCMVDKRDRLCSRCLQICREPKHSFIMNTNLLVIYVWVLLTQFSFKHNIYCELLSRFEYHNVTCEVTLWHLTYDIGQQISSINQHQYEQEAILTYQERSFFCFVNDWFSLASWSVLNQPQHSNSFNSLTKSMNELHRNNQ
jgi:hypothetical protein